MDNMEKNIQIFENSDFGKVRSCIKEDGSVLLCAADVARALGYTNPRAAVIRHCKGVTKCDTLTDGGLQPISFIPESDVYRLIFKSKIPQAEKFERWVVETILPSIRKTGMYIKGSENGLTQVTPQELAHMYKMLETIETELKPKADYYDALVERGLATNIRNTAKELRLPQKLFVYLLEDMKLVYRAKNQLLPTAFLSNMGYAVLREYTNPNNGHGGVQMLFTPKGRLYLMNRISKRLARKEYEKRNASSIPVHV